MPGPVSLTQNPDEELNLIRVIAGVTEEFFAPVRIIAGMSDPNKYTFAEAVLGASVGSLFLRTDGGSRSTLYVREPSGWVAK